MSKSVYNSWCVLNAENNPTSCVLALPGRGQEGSGIANWHRLMQFENTAIIGVSPKNLEWYAMPNGVKDQEEAVKEQFFAVESVKKILQEIQSHFKINGSKILVVGFSAGGVTALQTAIQLDYDLAGVISYGGTILDPSILPKPKNNTPYFIFHSKDDQAFDWKERYIPMHNGLKANKYPFTTAIRNFGGHTVYQEEMYVAGWLTAERMGYNQKEMERIYGKNLNIGLKQLKITHYS